MKATVNYLLAMEKSLRERLRQLDSLKDNSAKSLSYGILGSENYREEKPTYDIRQIDRKITQINRALFEINHKIKESNARTEVEMEVNYGDLISELA